MSTATTPTPAPIADKPPHGRPRLGRRTLAATALALVLALVGGLVGAPGAAAATPTFSDVGQGHPFLEEIEWMAAEGLSTGYEDGTFRPGEPVTRQAFAAFLYRAAMREARPARALTSMWEPPATPTFVDVPVGHPFYAEIEWMASQGLSTGYEDGTFRPAATISRQALAAFLYRGYQALQMAEVEAVARLLPTPTFSDVGQGHPFLEEVEWMADTGLSTGYEDGTYRPADPVTRQATAAFLYRFDQLLRADQT